MPKTTYNPQSYKELNDPMCSPQPFDPMLIYYNQTFVEAYKSYIEFVLEHNLDQDYTTIY